MNPRRLAQVAALVLLGALIANWQLVGIMLHASEVILFLVCAGWLGLLLASTGGLVRGKRWGAYALLALVPYSTMLLGTPLIPGIDHLGGLRGWPLLAAPSLVELMVAGFLAARLGRPAFAA
jgi:hypothetical protein